MLAQSVKSDLDVQLVITIFNTLLLPELVIARFKEDLCLIYEHSVSQRGDASSASDSAGGCCGPPLLGATLLHLDHHCHRLRQPTALASPPIHRLAQHLHCPLPSPLRLQVKTCSEGYRPPFGDKQV